MPGISIGGTPKWIRTRDGAYKTYDMDEILKMKAAVDADRIACGKGVPCKNIPYHMTGHYYMGDPLTVPGGGGFVTKDPYAYTYHCRSLSRWYNPNTGQMEGHAHCTCDGCF
jgi:hypothetical protein